MVYFCSSCNQEFEETQYADEDVAVVFCPYCDREIDCEDE